MTEIIHKTCTNESSTQNFYREIATKHALKSTIKSKCAAVLVLRGKILSVGTNAFKAISTGKKSCLLRAYKVYRTR